MRWSDFSTFESSVNQIYGWFDLFSRQMRKELRKTKDKVKKPAFTMATTTRLVTQIFDSLFQGEIDDKSGQGSKRRRCGICEVLWLCDLIFPANLRKWSFTLLSTNEIVQKISLYTVALLIFIQHLYFWVWLLLGLSWVTEIPENCRILCSVRFLFSVFQFV